MTAEDRAYQKRASKERAYARGDCVDCYQPHHNVIRATDGTVRPARVCGDCQTKRTFAQRVRRARQKAEAAG